MHSAAPDDAAGDSRRGSIGDKDSSNSPESWVEHPLLQPDLVDGEVDGTWALFVSGACTEAEAGVLRKHRITHVLQVCVCV